MAILAEESQAAVKEARSPFAIFEGETHSCLDEALQVDEEELEYLLRNNFIGRIENILLTMINRFSVLNTRQLCYLVELCGVSVRKQAIERSLKKLTHKGFIKRTAFTSDNVQAVRYSYTLSADSQRVCESFVNIFNTEEFSTADLKRILSVNQVLICAMADNIKTQFKPEGFVTVGGFLSFGKRVKYDAVIDFDTNCFYVCSYRKTLSWEKRFVSELSLYKQLVKQTKARVMIVAEDSVQAAWLKAQSKGIPGFIVTHDRELHSLGFAAVTNC